MQRATKLFWYVWDYILDTTLPVKEYVSTTFQDLSSFALILINGTCLTGYKLNAFHTVVLDKIYLFV
jgi:hypothetical protein